MVFFLLYNKTETRRSGKPPLLHKGALVRT